MFVRQTIVTNGRDLGASALSIVPPTMMLERKNIQGTKGGGWVGTAMAIDGVSMLVVEWAWMRWLGYEQAVQ